MNILNYLESRKSIVEHWYSKEAENLKLSCLETDKVIDIMAWLADDQEASLAVVDPKHLLVGIISERDVIKYLAKDNVLNGDLRVSDLMTRNVFSASPDTYCVDALKIMVKGDFRNLPVRKNANPHKPNKMQIRKNQTKCESTKTKRFSRDHMK